MSAITGHEVAAIRKFLGWSRPEFASLLGASESAVRRWEQLGGEKVPLEARFEDYCTILREEIARDSERVKDVLWEHRRDVVRALYHLLAIRYGSPFDSIPLPRLDPPM